MKRYTYLLCLLLLGFAQAGVGQTLPNSKQPGALNAIAKPGSTTEWVKVCDEVKLDAVTFFTESRTALGLEEEDTFELVKEETDHLGMTHHRFQQSPGLYYLEVQTGADRTVQKIIKTAD